MIETQYYKKIKNKRVAIFGITPPPLGGVSIHIKRVAQELKKNNNHIYHFQTDFRGRRYLLPFYLIYALLYLFWNKINILHYHSMYQPNSFTEIKFLVFLKKFLNFKLILIEHNCNHMYSRDKNSLKNFKKTIKNIDEIIFMGNSPYKSYTDNNINLIKNYSINIAFLPPDITKKNKILKTYPDLLNTFIKKNHPILLINASRVYMLKNKDVYGLDTSIKAIKKLKKDYPNIGLIIAFANIGDKTYLNQLLLLIKKENLDNNIFLLTGNNEIWPLFQKVDIFLRPTLCDGASVSLQEALFFGSIVIASNVCKRPQNTIIFDIDNKTDFINKINYAIKKLPRTNEIF